MCGYPAVPEDGRPCFIIYYLLYYLVIDMRCVATARIQRGVRPSVRHTGGKIYLCTPVNTTRRHGS